MTTLFVFAFITVMAIEFDGTNVASIIVALVAMGTALASQRSSSKASRNTAKTQAEEEAYVRAREFDAATIIRLEAEVAQLRTEREAWRDEREELVEQVDILRWRINRLEQGLPPVAYPYKKDQHD